MNLGHFSLSLAVKDIDAAYDFYRRLGFTLYDGRLADKWVILKSGDTLLGLFEGMFEQNILSFHTPDLATVRGALAAAGLELPPVDESGDAATYLMLTDPDGNPILIDQTDPDYRPSPSD